MVIGGKLFSILLSDNSPSYVRDGNLRDNGAKNWVHIPTPEVQSALELSDADFQVRYYLFSSISCFKPSLHRHLGKVQCTKAVEGEQHRCPLYERRSINSNHKFSG